MSDKIPSPPERGEEWWRSLHTKEKLAILKPYFDQDKEAKEGEHRITNQDIANTFQIHVSSVGLQRRRYLQQRGLPLPQENDWTQDGLPSERRTYRRKKDRPQPPEPKNKGQTWWTSTTKDDRWTTIRYLIDVYGMSNKEIAEHLELKTRNQVAGVRDRSVVRVRQESPRGTKVTLSQEIKVLLQVIELRELNKDECSKLERDLKKCPSVLKILEDL